MIAHPADVLDLLTDALWTAQNDADIAAEAYETHDAGEPDAAEQAAYLRERARLARAVSDALTGGDTVQRARALTAIMEAIR